VTEPAQPQPAAPAEPVPASQPVTIEPVDTQPDGPAAVGFPGEPEPAEPGPGAAGAEAVVPGAPAEVVDLGGAHIATQLRTGGATSNETPSLPQNIQSAGAKAHAGLDVLIKTAEDDSEDAETKLPQVVAIAKELQADLDRYVPESIRQAAMVDVEKLLRKIHL
jgi:hypothetical protein